MNQTDKILMRRLYLQRYITQATNEIIETLRPTDKLIIQALQEFVSDADEKAIIALSNHRTSNDQVKALLAGVKALIEVQKTKVLDYLDDELPLFIKNEAEAIVAAMGGSEVPKMSGVKSLPVGGLPIDKKIGAAFGNYENRVISTLTTLPATADMVPTFRGTKTENFKDGLIYWRDNSLVSPNVNQILNGVATNADERVYGTFRVRRVDFLATLDFRTCTRCLSAEMGSPYELGEAPKPALHPRCVIGETIVSADSPVSATTKRRFNGDVIVIRTASGNNLTCTPNHPILTSGGFIPASLLNVGGDVISDRGINRKLIINDDHQYVPTSIEKLSDAFRRSFNMSSVEVPVSTDSFHGDGGNGGTALISYADCMSDGQAGCFDTSERRPSTYQLCGLKTSQQKAMTGSKLHSILHACRKQVSSLSVRIRHYSKLLSYDAEPQAVCGDSVCRKPFLSAFYAQSPQVMPIGLRLFFSEWLHDFLRPTRSSFAFPSLFRARILGAGAHSKCHTEESIFSVFFGSPRKFPCLSLNKTVTVNDSTDTGIITSDNSVKEYQELAEKIMLEGGVFVDDIVDIERKAFNGHVYNLETENEYYTANGIINHNCRCVLIPHIADMKNERPYVKDDRSVKDIPKEERAGKIGQTRDNIEQFFSRLPDADMRAYLGKSRYELWKSGKIDSLKDLVDSRTLRPLRLDELP